MRPDAQIAFAETLAGGPARLPADLLVGPRAAQLRGLRAYANTISHARYKALEETFPRTRAAMGDEAFHAAATAFLDTPSPHRRPIRLIGDTFADSLAAPAHRDLATVEWLLLEAHGAAEAPAVTLAGIAGLTPSALLAARVMRHPATCLAVLEAPAAFRWDGAQGGSDGFVLLTRPEAQRQVRQVNAAIAALVAALDAPIAFADLLESDADAVTALVEAGALTPAPEFL
ncbi:HvfC/BufC family peptide modification chaperone [Sphingomicrobium aestuariivivum]|uniref:HvfC/BufC family peptide modification chaperone n=1 Tax=Sphingomicrobium aestuariivivum TaxID=1582356 RepID=UPI001FD6455A|nr:putative DNA-binding domain-containing protein [Sphingomicrobium aestuariivivum]MCJ8190299.1 DNA-binding domain-containing protein [Sphingomicrobium aestuariivivum]